MVANALRISGDENADYAGADWRRLAYVLAIISMPWTVNFNAGRRDISASGGHVRGSCG
jgi:hypothetical protein